MDAKNIVPKNKYQLKIILGILASLFTLALLGTIYFNYRWKNRLTNAIKYTVIDASDSLYSVSFADININLLSGSVKINQITLHPNLRIYEKLKRQKLAPDNLIELKISKLFINKVNPLKVLKDRNLAIDEIRVENPLLTISYTKLKNQKPKKHKTPYQSIKNILNELKIGALLLSDVKFKYIDYNFKKAKITTINNLNLSLNGILINATSALDTKRVFNAEDVIAEINNYEYLTPDKNYKIKIKHAKISTQKKQLELQGFGLIPRYNEANFANKFKFQQERYAFNMDTIYAYQIDFKALLNGRTFAASNVSLINGNFNVFLNRTKPKRLVDKGRNFPQIALKRLNWGLNIDTLQLKKISVSYGEFYPLTKEKGTVYFNDVFGRIYNLTNDTLALQKNNFCEADLNTTLMGEGSLFVHLGLNLTDPKGTFSYKGKLGPMQTSKINDIMRPLAMMTTSSGRINELTFNINGNINGAQGKLTLNYSNLNIIIMKKEEEKKYVRMGLISLFANALLIERNNPSANRPIRVIYPNQKRSFESSFLNLMWKTILVGIKESIGITKVKEAIIKRTMDNFAQAKIERGIRKSKRLKRKSDKLKLLINPIIK
jgi:hypothetical protein